MLSIGKLGRGQERYYLEKVAEGAEDYYSGEGEAEGYWLGDAAEDLGLQGEVTPAQLVAMLTGDNPATGEPLGLRHVAGKGSVPGFDLTFSAPKSVSLTWALAGEGAAAEVKAAHAEAVSAALDYLQEVACLTRRGAGGYEFVPGNGFLAAAYVHRSSRAGDPQLHTHVLIANATRGPDGRWTRLYHPAIYEQAKTGSAIYEAHLRDELTRRLGVRWGEVRNGIADIEGFDPAHLRAFSKRRAEILEAVGPDASANARQVAALLTRDAKEQALSIETLRDRWRTKTEEIGLTREAIRATFGHERQAPEGRVRVAEVEQFLTAHASHFDRREVIQAIANCLPAGAPGAEVVELADAYLATSEVILIASTPKGHRYTTREIWELERKALGQVEEMAATGDRAVVSEIVVSRLLAERPSIKPDQRAMVERLLTGREGVVVVVGEAGTGKTYALAAAARGWSASGRELRVAAPTWRAANVLRSEGLAAVSVASLLAELDRKGAAGSQPLAPGSVLVIDEAGMVDSRSLARVIEHARAAEAKLVLIGDPAQLGEIEAGGLFAAIEGRTEPIRLDEVIRHEHELDREGAARIRAGEGGEALSVYQGEGRVTVAEDPVARREAMVEDWWQSFGTGEDSLMIARTNREVRELNARARERMKEEGRLGEREIEVAGQCFAEGDHLITRINDHRAQIHNRERWRVAEVDVESGALVLDGIDTARRVGVDAVYLGRVRERDGGPAIEHAYAATIYQAQGATVEMAFVAVDPGMDRQQFYVAASRSRGETFFYATPEAQLEREEYAPRSPHLRDGLKHIAEAAERDGSQAAAHDEALRSALGKLPTEELVARMRELASEAGAETHVAEQHERIGGWLARDGERLAEIDAEREALPAPPSGRRHRAEREQIAQEERWLSIREKATRERMALNEAELEALPEVRQQARAELAVARHLMAERERGAAAAARISPPDYIKRELGERPGDLVKRAEWDRAVRGIEGYRLRNGVRDKERALGAKPRERSVQREQQRVQEAILRSQRALELKRARTIARAMDIGLLR